MRDHAAAPATTPEIPTAEPRSQETPIGLTAASVLALQRSAGNAAVTRMLARRERGAGSTLRAGTDWTEADRVGNTTAWQSANEANLMALRSSEYATPAERSAFYRWYYIATTTRADPARRSECRWPLAASIVAAGVWDMVNLPNSEDIAKSAGVTSEEVQTILRRGNQIIMDDVFPKLREQWVNPLQGQAALDWDAQTLAEEQNLMQPLYDGASPAANAILQNMATGTWTSAQVGAQFAASANVAPGPNIRGGRVPWFTGTMTDMATRWRYGNRIANTFSTITPAGTAPTAPPTVAAGYSNRSLFGGFDWRRNLQAFEAATDNRITDSAEHTAAINAMKAFSEREQHYFLGNWDFYMARCRMSLGGAYYAFDGMVDWTANLPVQIRFLDALGMNWREHVDYGSGTKNLRTMVMARRTDEGRAAVRGSYFQDIFVKVCNNSTIITAVNDLGLANPERQRWIDDELSW